jgi:hypothetical protein
MSVLPWMPSPDVNGKSGLNQRTGDNVSEHLCDLPAIPGLPTAEDVQRWRELMQPHVDEQHELVGVRLVEGGAVMGIVARRPSA